MIGSLRILTAAFIPENTGGSNKTFLSIPRALALLSARSHIGDRVVYVTVSQLESFHCYDSATRIHSKHPILLLKHIQLSGTHQKITTAFAINVLINKSLTTDTEWYHCISQKINTGVIM